MNIETVVQSIKLQAADADQAQSAKSSRGEPVAPPVALPSHSAPDASTFDATKAAAAQIDSYLKSVGRNLDIHVDHDTGRTVVVVRDTSTGDVIRQIPSEEALRLARSLAGGNNAALVNLTA
jgi:flagellar protein FlaG